MNKINFIQHKSSNYRDRTIENAKSDITLAFAIDFESHGEVLTRKSAVSAGKLYFPIKLGSNNWYSNVVETIWRNKEKLLIRDRLSINIAGNGIYTLKDWGTQEQVDMIIYEQLNYFFSLLNYEISINCGGQTGVDEAGAIAGIFLGLDVTVLSTFDWKFRDITGKDICDEILFKKRFLGCGY